MTTATEFGEARPRLLYLTQELPFADDAGHKIRSRQLIEALVRSFDVTVAGFIEDGTASSHRLMGCRVIAERAAVRIRRQPVRLAQAVATAIVVRNLPYSLGKFDNRRLFRRLRAHGESASPAIVVANLAMAGYLDALPRAVRIIDAHNVEAALWRDFQAAAPPMARPFVRREARLLEGVERAAWAGAQGVIAICAEDGRTIVSEAPDARVLVAPLRWPGSPRPREVMRSAPTWACSAYGHGRRTSMPWRRLPPTSPPLCASRECPCASRAPASAQASAEGSSGWGWR